VLLGQKIHPLNFHYGTRIRRANSGFAISAQGVSATVTCQEITPFCARLTFDNAKVADKRNYSDGIREELRRGKKVTPGKDGRFRSTAAEIAIRADRLSLKMAGGVTLDTGAKGFGFVGERQILAFNFPAATAFYGFGETTRRLNKNGDFIQFHTIDVAGVLPHENKTDSYDPGYVSIPLAILKQGATCVGIYFDNPERLIMDIGQIEPGRMIFQSMGGNNDVYFINGPTLRDVVRNFTELTGRCATPAPWALGYHQCRWGYRTEEDLRAQQREFARHRIPVSALWYDIDYMDAYRVFTWDRTDFPNPKELNADLKKAGIRAVAIIDPGVKLDPGYRVYDSGRKSRVFCKNPAGSDYVGRVWPGDTVFPDFTLPRARAWWAKNLAVFMEESGLDGAWLDMNDPSTGWSSSEEMLFHEGKIPHAKFHNQYGHFMAKASREAFALGGRNEEPFLLTRSASTGTQRYSAVWTGDNFSNWSHLRMSIPMTLNLGLSGVAFNGPDVGGFAGNTDEELLTRWFQAGFLFPFFRNHTICHSKTQEPWEFSPKCLQRVRDVILTRYRLLPYLWSCFAEHAATGDPVLRPLAYAWDDPAFENIDDQYLVGSHIMVAPIVEPEGTANVDMVRGEKRQIRHVALPPGDWFDLMLGQWIEGGRTIRCAASKDEVPLFVRNGSVIPWDGGALRNANWDWKKLELHVFQHGDGENQASLPSASADAVAQMVVTRRDGRLRLEGKGDRRSHRSLTLVDYPGSEGKGGGASRSWCGKRVPVVIG
jgi:alpha-glucosidase